MNLVCLNIVFQMYDEYHGIPKAICWGLRRASGASISKISKTLKMLGGSLIYLISPSFLVEVGPHIFEFQHYL